MCFFRNKAKLKNNPNMWITKMSPSYDLFIWRNIRSASSKALVDNLEMRTTLLVLDAPKKRPKCPHRMKQIKRTIEKKKSSCE